MYQRNFQQIPQQQIVTSSPQIYQQMPPQPPNQQQYMMIKQQNGALPYEVKNGQQIRIPYQQQPQQFSSPQIQAQQPYQQNGTYMQNGPFIQKQQSQQQQQQQQQQYVQIAQQAPQAVQYQQNIISNGSNVFQNGSSVYSQTSSTQNTLGNSRILSPERKTEEVDSQLKYENEKLHKQYSHLETLLETFQNFERTKNINDLKIFNQKFAYIKPNLNKSIDIIVIKMKIQHQNKYKNEMNEEQDKHIIYFKENDRFILNDLIDEIYDYKAKFEEEKRRGDELRQQSAELKQTSIQPESSSQPNVFGPLLSLQNQELQKKLEQLKDESSKIRNQMNDQENKKNQQEYYVETKEQLESQIQNLEETEKQLQQEVELLVQSNQKLVDNLSKKDFFKEYDFMCREKRGLQDQNDKVTKEIKVKDDELYKLKGKQESPFPQCGMGLPPPRQ